MFPLNDTEPNRYNGLPSMTLAIICLNVLVFVLEPFMIKGSRMYLYILYGSSPYLILTQQGSGAISSITSTFLHADLWHLTSNMLALWVFARRVEDACGPWRFLCFYLTCGLCADILSTIVRANSAIPGIGASGAVFGLMGAYLLLFPGGRIRTLVILWIVPTFPKIPAFWVTLYFLAVQVVPAINVVLHNEDYRINYWAHVGGFLGGLLVFCFLRPEAFARYMNDTPV